MRWEAQAVNADFWSSVLQARCLGALDFALGAVMAMPRAGLEAIGGFDVLAGCLADDFQLGRKVAESGAAIELCPVVVECRSAPIGWREVWAHQVRWARTIRVCRPVPYFLSILSNATVWPLLWLIADPGWLAGWGLGLCLALRLTVSRCCERKMAGPQQARDWWFAPAKDLLQLLIWALAFSGSRVTWRGRQFRVRAGGQLIEERESRSVGAR